MLKTIVNKKIEYIKYTYSSLKFLKISTYMLVIYPLIYPTINPLILTYSQWEFQDPKMEVLYHIRLYFVGNSLT